MFRREELISLRLYPPRFCGSDLLHLQSRWHYREQLTLELIMTKSIDEGRFDAAKTFARIEEELECDPTDELEWQFLFTHQDGNHLAAVAETLGDALATKLDVEFDSVIFEFDDEPAEDEPAEDETGSEVASRPQVTLIYIGSLTIEELSSVHQFLRELAQRHKITYDGVRYMWP